MGAWSHLPFGNDTAYDWAYGLEEAKDLSYIEGAFDKLQAVGEGYLNASDSEEAIAAAEVLAKLLGKGNRDDAYPETVDEWMRRTKAAPTPALLNKARQALQRILSENSEIAELWDEADDGEQWRKCVEQLLSEISA